MPAWGPVSGEKLNLGAPLVESPMSGDEGLDTELTGIDQLLRDTEGSIERAAWMTTVNAD